MSALWGDRPTYSHTGARRRGQHRATFRIGRAEFLTMAAVIVPLGLAVAGVR